MFGLHAPRTPKPFNVPVTTTFHPFWMTVAEWPCTGEICSPERTNCFRRLTAYVQRQFARALARGILEDDPHSLPSVLNPLYDPALELANKLDLPLHSLDVMLRAHSGLSARQWWDVFRVAEPIVGLEARLRLELHDFFSRHSFHPDAHDEDEQQAPEDTEITEEGKIEAGSSQPHAGRAPSSNPQSAVPNPQSSPAPAIHPSTSTPETCRSSSSLRSSVSSVASPSPSNPQSAPPPSLEELQTTLRRHRRALGATVETRTWQAGFLNSSRLRRATLAHHHLGLTELERRLLLEIRDTWTWDAAARRLAAPPGFLRVQRTGRWSLLQGFTAARNFFVRLRGHAEPDDARRWQGQSRADQDDPDCGRLPYNAFKRSDHDLWHNPYAFLDYDPLTGHYAEVHVLGEQRTAKDLGPVLPPEIAEAYGADLDPGVIHGSEDIPPRGGGEERQATEHTETTEEGEVEAGKSQPLAGGVPLSDPQPSPAPAVQPCRSSSASRSSESSVTSVASPAPVRTPCNDFAISARSANPLPVAENGKEPASHSFCKSPAAARPLEAKREEKEEPGAAQAPPRAHAAAGA